MSSDLIITSLPPSPTRLVNGADIGRDYIAQCIYSWRAAGFDVLSINPPAELDSVAALGLPVSLAASSSPELPLISEMLSAARASGCRLAGIVNADCHMLPVEKLRDRLKQRSVGRMLLCERVDRDQTSLLPAVETNGGFDGFFFDPQSVCITKLAEYDPRFRLGDVWWDFWFPCVAMAQGLEVRRLKQPVLGHLNHVCRWNPECYSANRERFARSLRLLGQQLHALPELTSFAAVMDQVAGRDPASFAFITRRWLRHSADCRELALYDYPASLGEEYMALLQRLCQYPQRQSEGPLPPNTHVKLAAGFSGCRHLASGWSFPEDWGCWIDGGCGELVFGPAMADGDLQVELTLRAHVSQMVPEQAVTICVNDVPLASEAFHDDNLHRMSFIVPPRVTKGDTHFRLSIWASEPHTPRSSHGAADDRNLGIGVAAILACPC